jgi:hypothetical protein
MQMVKKLNAHVMKTEFREGLRDVYREALTSAGVTPQEVKPHIYGGATVKVTDAELAKLRSFYGDKLVELSGHGNSGAIEIILPAGEEFLLNNRPTLTDEEREAKKGTGEGRGGVSAEVREKREASRKRMEELLKSRYGIDLKDNRPSVQDDETADEDEAEGDEPEDNGAGDEQQDEAPRGKGRGKNRIG